MLEFLAQGREPNPGGLVCGLIGGLTIGTLIGAVILRAGIALYNKFVGGEESGKTVPEPDFNKAATITFVTAVVNMVVGFVVGFVAGAQLQASGFGPTQTQAIATAISLPISYLVMAALLTNMLPTKFNRAMLVCLCQLLIIVVIVIGVIALTMVSRGIFRW